MGFIWDGLDAEAYDREYTDRELLRRIIGYFRPHLRAMILVAVLIVLNAVMDAAFPFLIARSLDRLQGAADLDQTIWQRTAWLIGLIFLSGALIGSLLVAVLGWATWFFACAGTPSMPCWPVTCRSTTSSPRAASSAV